jgi:hypothetical protein
MDEVGGELVAGEAADVVAHDDALGERLVHGHGDPAPELGLADEDEAEPVLRVHLVVGEETEILEHLAAEVLGLVHDEDRAHPRLDTETRHLGADDAVQRGAAPLRSVGRPSSQAIDLYMSVTLPVESGT